MNPGVDHRDCQHLGSPHQHGTRDAYVLDICRCGECRQANAAVERERRREIAYGRWQPFVDAEPTRQHLRALSERGIGLRRAAQLSGVPYTTLAQLVHGASSTGSRPSRQIRQDTASNVLALSLDGVTPAAGARVEATGTRRRIHALVAIGWTIKAIADLLGRDVASVRHTLRRDSVTAATAAATAELYERLWDSLPDESTPPRRTAAAKARTMARRNGWLPAMAWDDIDDDPQPDPAAPTEPAATEDDQSDELDIDIVMDRVAAGIPIQLKPGRSRDEVIARLTHHGLSLPEIAELLDVTTRTISRRRRARRAA